MCTLNERTFCTPGNETGDDTDCDGIDDDCDGDVDESAIDAMGFFSDVDGDGYGDFNSPISQCFVTEGLVENNTDCNDDPSTDGSSMYPYATEYCNDKDDNCNSAIDEMAVDRQNYYLDQDGDGYEALEHGGTDCNDLDTSIRPGAEEIWYDGIDQNCDNANDFDQDGDGLIKLDSSAVDEIVDALKQEYDEEVVDDAKEKISVIREKVGIYVLYDDTGETESENVFSWDILKYLGED